MGAVMRGWVQFVVHLVCMLVTLHAYADAARESLPSAGRVTGITTIYPWEAEARSALPNGQLLLGTEVTSVTVPAGATASTTAAQDQPPASRAAELLWAGKRVTWAVAQQAAPSRAAVTSSGIGSWGVNRVPHPERALVEVLVGGAVAGLGVVLEGGAVLTSLSTIGRGLELSLSFADGTVEGASVRRTHRVYDLALLEPSGHKVRTGLPLARVLVEPLKLVERRSGDARNTLSNTPLVVHATRVVTVSWFGAVWGADGVPISGAIRPPTVSELGSPLITSSGHLAALVANACVAPLEMADKGPAGCRVARVGLGSRALGEFLGLIEVAPRHVGFGVIGETTDTGWARGVRVRGVNPGSPAAYAGLRAPSEVDGGDVIVAIDDVPVHDLSQLESVLKTQHRGAQSQLTVLRDGKLVQLPVRLPLGERATSGERRPSVTF